MTMLACQCGEKLSIGQDELRALVAQVLQKLNKPLRKVLIVPPDHTRLNSMAGPITAIIYDMLKDTAQIDIMPALGTHNPMSEAELRMMYGPTIPLDRFLVHDWRNDVVKVGQVPGKLLAEWSEGKVDYDVNVEVNKRLFAGYDAILSVGQVVPHEVIGLANYTKNIMVGVGGSDTINKSHFLGAACNMEKILGQASNPVRNLFNYGVNQFLAELPIVYILTVMEKDNSTGKMHMRGFYAGADEEAFLEAGKLSQKVNIQILDRELKKVVVYLDPEEFKSTWLGNKAVYRTRMAIADGGELIVLAPALKEFGEDKQIDKLVRKYGYKGTPATLQAVKNNEDIRTNLGAAAHLIHGSSEGRFKITYCPGPNMSLEEVRSVGFDAVPYDEMVKKYDPKKLKDGFNTMPDGEEVFYISNPALGLWAYKAKFTECR